MRTRWAHYYVEMQPRDICDTIIVNAQADREIASMSQRFGWSVRNEEPRHLPGFFTDEPFRNSIRFSPNVMLL